MAVARCSALEAIQVPPLVEYVGELCFQLWFTLSRFSVASAVHVRKPVDVPAAWDSGEVLDFVETLGPGQTGLGRAFVLHFGRESRPASVIMTKAQDLISPRCFLRVSARRVGILRENLEFDSVSCLSGIGTRSL
jgi:hypothetical protein